MARSLHLFSGAAMLSILAQSAAAFAADCFVDSVGGLDTNDGATEATAWQSPSKIAKTCTTVKFKRGSVFNIPAGSGKYAVNLQGTQVKTLTNYGDASMPLPQFIKPHEPSSGAVFSTYGQITIDGLYIAGSRSDVKMSNLADGICIMIGGGSASAPSVIKNNEITLCDIGMMTSGDYVVVQNNYVHDLSISVDAPPGVDPNAVGGAEGIFVNSSHVEVSYNRFINCSTAAQWVTNTNGGGVRCDGGATEVTVKYAGEVTDVNIHHNFSYNSCGFFEVSSMFNNGGGDYVKGKFTNSVFHDNVMIDSGWISLLQVNNTRLTNVRWENNTIVHHDMGSTTAVDGTAINLNDYGSSAIQAIAFNSTSSGVTGGGVIEAGDIFWTNNLWYFDSKVKPYNLIDPTHRGSDALLANITVTGDVVVTTDPGFRDITNRVDPNAFDLLSTASVAIDKGVSNADITADITTDFLGRARPVGAAVDLGAFEYDASAGGAPALTTAAGGSTWNPTTGTSTTGGTKATGGTASAAAGATPSGTGGVKAIGGTSGKAVAGGSTKAVGGSSGAATGGTSSVASSVGGKATSTTGGASTSSSEPQGGQGPTAGGSSAQPTGGQSATSSANPESTGGQVGSTTPGSSTDTGQGGGSVVVATGGTPTSGLVSAPETAGCGCRTAGSPSNGVAGAGLLALGAMLFRRSRRRRS
jgi:MYXO-CTERM domain-containing protein